MLNALVRCAKAIYSEYKLAVLPIYNSSVIGGKTRHSVKIDEGTHTRDEVSYNLNIEIEFEQLIHNLMYIDFKDFKSKLLTQF